MATEGTGAASCGRPRAGLEDLALRDRSRPARRSSSPNIDGSGAIQQIWMTPTGDWRQQHPPHLLGRPGAAVRRVPGRRFLRHGLGHVRAALVAGRLRQPGQRLQLLLGDAVPQARRITLTNLRRRACGLYYQINYTLTDVPDDARLLPRPVPPGQPAAVQGGAHDPRRRRGPRPLRRHATWPGASTTTAGGARARSSSTSTATASSRRSAAPAPRTISAARTTSRTSGPGSTRSSPRPTPGCPR